MNILVVGVAGHIGEATKDIFLQGEQSRPCVGVLLYKESYRKAVDFIYQDMRDCE